MNNECHTITPDLLPPYSPCMTGVENHAGAEINDNARFTKVHCSSV